MNDRREPKFSAGIWAFTSCIDRFATMGYRDELSLEEKVALGGRTKGLDGLILQYPAVVTDENADQAAQLMKDEGLEVAAVDASLFNRHFQQGAFTNPDPKIRREAIDLAKRTVDMAERMGTEYAGIWLGQDGYDYLFQYNYNDLWKYELDALAEVAAHGVEEVLAVLGGARQRDRRRRRRTPRRRSGSPRSARSRRWPS